MSTRSILLICGSMNEESVTRMALQVVGDALENKGFETEYVDVADLNLQVYNPMNETVPESIVELSDKITQADAVVIGTPEYHGGYSGALKNMMDHLNGSIFRQKAIAILSAAGGYRSGINALNGLRLICRNVHARCISEQAAVSHRDLLENEEGLVFFNETVAAQLLSVADGLEREIKFADFLQMNT